MTKVITIGRWRVKFISNRRYIWTENENIFINIVL